jgi:hypothetical protein
MLRCEVIHGVDLLHTDLHRNARVGEVEACPRSISTTSSSTSKDAMTAQEAAEPVRRVVIAPVEAS